MKLLTVLVLCLAVNAYATPAPLFGKIKEALTAVVGGVVGTVKDVVGGVVGTVANIADLGEDIFSGVLRALYYLGRILFRGIERILNLGRNVGSGCGCLSRTINGLVYGFTIIIQQTITIIANIVTVQSGCFTVITKHSSVLVTLSSVSGTLGAIDLTKLNVLNTVKFTSTQLIAEVNKNINFIFGEIKITVNVITRALGGLGVNLSSIVVRINNGLVSLISTISKMSNSVKQNGQYIVLAVSAVTIAIQDFITDVQSIAQNIVKILPTATVALIEAVYALGTLLSFIIQVVVTILVPVAKIFQGISPNVHQVLESAIAAFTYATNGVEQLYNLIVNCINHSKGIRIGFQINITILVRAISCILVDYIQNTKVIYVIEASFKEVAVKLGVTEIVSNFQSSLAYVFDVLSALINDIQIVIGSVVIAVRTIVISLGVTITDIINNIVSLIGKVVTYGIVQTLVNVIDPLIHILADELENLLDTTKPLLEKASDNIKLALDSIIRTCVHITTFISVGSNNFCGKIAHESTVPTTTTTTTTNSTLSDTPVIANVNEDTSFLFSNWTPAIENVLTTTEYRQVEQSEITKTVEYTYTVENIPIQ